MHLRRISKFFTAAGVVLGAVAILGYAFDLVPPLPPAALKLVIYKLTFIGAVGLVVFGAVVGRLARKREDSNPGKDPAAQDPGMLRDPGPAPEEWSRPDAELSERMTERRGE